MCSPNNHENQNSKEYLENCVKQIVENLRHLEAAPSVQMQRECLVFHHHSSVLIAL